MSTALGLALTASCSSETRSPSLAASSAHTDDALRVRPAVDLQTVVKRTSLAFRQADHGMLAAGGATFEAKVTGAAIEITPRRPTASSGGVGAPLTLETSLVSRGSLVLADASRDRLPTSATLERDGSVTVWRGDIAEKIENDEGGVEQSWRFERAPAGGGDLVVRVHAKGQSYSKSTDHGLHFIAGGPQVGEGGVGLRYGTATWVDATGKRTVVVPHFAGGEIVMSVPGDVVATSSYPAVLDPTITPEQEIDKPISGSSASGDQYNPSIVSAGQGKGFMAVWYDRRGVRPSLYGARLASNGTVLDDTGIPIATGVGSTSPFIAASDAGFLVTWAVSYVDLYQGPGIYAVRLDAQGQAIDTTPLTLVANETNLQQPSAAFDGTSWLVAWQRYGGGTTGYDIAGLRVPRSGAPLDAAPFVISAQPDAEYQPLVTFDGKDQLVTWRGFNAIYGRKYGKDGMPLTDRLLLATPSGFSLNSFSVAFDGNQHLLVWSNYGLTSYDVFARRIAVSGLPIDPGNLAVSTGPEYDERPRAAWDGVSFVITYSRSGQLAAQRMNTAGGLIDAVGTVVNNTGNYYDYGLASDRVGTIAVSRIFGTGLAGADVVGVSIGRPPIPGAPAFIVSKAANSETEPATAWNGTSHVAVWLDTRDGRPAIYGAGIAADGQPSAPTKIVSDPRFSNDLTRPRVASDGAGGYLVVFYAYEQLTGKRGVRGVRIDGAGTPDSTGVFDIYVPPIGNEYAQEPNVAFDGTNYLVVWQNQTNDGTSQTSIAGIRLPKTGTVVVDKEPIRITAANPVDSRTVPSVAFDGQNYYVAWITSRPTPAGGIQVSHVYGSRVSKEGAVLDGEQAVCNAFLLQLAPSVAADTKNGGFMVVWEDYRTSLESADVYGARISAQGQNLDGAAGMKIAVGPQDESRPRIAPSGDGTNWVVAWRDLRSKTTYDIYGSWVSVAGKNHDPEGLALSAEAGDEDAPWLSASKDGNLLVSYQRLDPRTGYGSYRVRARAINSGAKLAAACKKNDDCASRSCVDGVCCYTECGACGQCNVTPGTCTPRAANTEAPTCPAYRCKGTLECPAKCENDTDCASNATCDPTKKCVSRVFCVDDQTLKDLTGKQSSCAPYRCTADACRTQCGSVDDCAGGFVCDNGGRCVQAPAGSDGGCAASPSSSSTSGGALLAGAIWMLGAIVARRRRR